MTGYVKGYQWSRDLLIVSMTIRLCQNHIESIVDNIYDKLKQKFVSATVWVYGHLCPYRDERVKDEADKVIREPFD